MPRGLDDAVGRIARLEAQVAEAQAMAAAVQDQFLRERAELDNFKRRMQKDKAEALRYATEPVLRDLLGVIDNLERALKAARGEATREGGAPAGQLGALL
ncbi:MAG: nucleotide exchange factor GrpE, partial [Alphaproteobacteria bacterium]